MEGKEEVLQQLINEVQQRPALWNKYDYHYNNRTHMDAEWMAIAATLNKDKDFLKQKWRNLRDQFHREVKKVKIPPKGADKPYIQFYRGKWVHFEALLFLRYSFQSHRKRSKRKGEMSNSENNEDENVMDYDNNQDYVEESDVGETSGTITEENIFFEIKEEEVDPQYEEANQPQIIKPSELVEYEVQVPMKIPKKSLKSTKEEDDNDDDLHFLKSLVPYFKKMNPVRKLIVRNEIQNLLLRESLCDNCKFGEQSSCH